MLALLRRSSLLLAFAASAAAGQRDTAFTWSKRLADGAQLTIVNPNGPIAVRAGAGDRVEVRAIVTAVDRGNVNDATFDVQERAADDIRICTVYRNRSACGSESLNDIRVSVRYIVSLPKTTRLRASTGNGDITIDQTTTAVDIETGNGKIIVSESSARVTAFTGNGDISVAAARGPVRVRTGNGRIVANTTKGPVDAATGNGDIDVKIGSLDGDPDLMTFSTGSGAVRVALPADFNGELNASTGNGSITTDFEVRVQGRLSTTRLRGVIGNGNGPMVRVSSGNGRLEVRKY